MKRFLVPAIAAISMLAGGVASASDFWVKPGVTLNVRLGPNTYYEVVGSAHACQKLDVIKWENGWAQINWNGYQYWVFAAYLQDYKCAYNPPKKVYNTYVAPPPPYVPPKPTYVPPKQTYGGSNY